MPTTIDGFEDGDLSEYTTSGTSTSTVTVTSSRSFDGSNSLLIGESSSGVTASSQSGLPYYPSDGDIFRVWMWANNGVGRERPRFGFFLPNDGVPNTGNGADGYSVLLDYDNADWRIIDGSGTLATDGSVTVNDHENEWVTYEVDTTGSDIVANLYDSNGNLISSISTNDNRWSSGGIGFRNDGGGSLDYSYFDLLEYGPQIDAPSAPQNLNVTNA